MEEFRVYEKCVVNLAALCVGEVTVVCASVCVFKNIFLFHAFFLNMVIATAIKILYATSNSCKLSFQVLTKKFIDGKPLKSWQEKIQR